MKILFSCFFLLCIMGAVHSQQTQLEFIPASDTYFPYVNAYSDSDGIAQYYMEDSKWVKNTSIPSFDDKGKFKDFSLQYIMGDKTIPPQLFAYSQLTGDFSFYFLTNSGWMLNDNIPSGKINIKAKKIIAEYSPAVNEKSGYIFSYSSDGSKLQLLEISGNKWSQIKFFPEALPQG